MIMLYLNMEDMEGVIKGENKGVMEQVHLDFLC